MYFEKGRCDARDVPMDKVPGGDRHETRCVKWQEIDWDNPPAVGKAVEKTPVGDVVLRNLIDLCKGMLRPTDVIGRYGGEEFCVLFSETGMLGSYQAAERLRRKIEETSFTMQDRSFSITVSIGLACLEMMGDRSVSVNDLIEEADKALYSAKEDGRNRIHTNCQGFPVGMQLETPQTASLRASKLNFDDIT